MDDDDIRHLTPTSNETGPAIILGKLSHQLEVRTSEEDWTGLADAAERRKLQNRLNQRIYRRRRRAQKPSQDSNSTTSHAATPKSVGSRSVGDSVEVSEPGTDSPAANQSLESISRRVGPTGPVATQVGPSAHKMRPTKIEEKMVQFEKLALRDYMLGSPRVDQLLTLIQFNVFRALVSNTFTLGFNTEWFEEEDAISPWVSNSLGKIDASCPTSLRPTKIQRTISHHPWIDLWPIPRMRDNILLARDCYDEDALCNDLVDFYDVPHERTGLIVWRDPWDPSGWEVSKAFVDNWGWVLKGCEELVISTDYWRAQRGEASLFF